METAQQHWYVSVECQDVNSMMALQKNVNATACVVETVNVLTAYRL